jgi:RNA polymerase sigma factor (sigma-70 family)
MIRGSSALAAPIAVPAIERTDRELVEDARAGDDAAFACLYDRYRRRIASYAYGMVNDHARAEDIAQDVFISALRRMRETERPIAFKPWIYEIARNACIDHFRRGKRAEEVSYDADNTLGGADFKRLVNPEPTPDVALDTKQQLDDLCGAFGGLSETHHQILLLRELEGLSYREIGDRMGLTRAAVESTLFRARRRLNEEYDDLVSGRRCARIQAIIAAAAEGMLGIRDRRRMMRHLSYCQACRSEARLLGVRETSARRRVAERVKALLPFPVLPAFLRRGDHASGTAVDGRRGRASGMVAQWTASVGPTLEPLAAGWAKAATAAATIAVAGIGAGLASGPLHAPASFPWSVPPIAQGHKPTPTTSAGTLRMDPGVFGRTPTVGVWPHPALLALPAVRRSGVASSRGVGGRGNWEIDPGLALAVELPRLNLSRVVDMPDAPARSVPHVSVQSTASPTHAPQASVDVGVPPPPAPTAHTSPPPVATTAPRVAVDASADAPPHAEVHAKSAQQ